MVTLSPLTYRTVAKDSYLKPYRFLLSKHLSTVLTETERLAILRVPSASSLCCSSDTSFLSGHHLPSVQIIERSHDLIDRFLSDDRPLSFPLDWYLVAMGEKGTLGVAQRLDACQHGCCYRAEPAARTAQLLPCTCTPHLFHAY